MQGGELVRIAALQFSVQVCDAVTFAAGLKVVAQPAHVSNRQWPFFGGDGAQHAHGIAAGGYPVFTGLVKGDHPQQVGPSLRTQLSETVVGMQGILRLVSRQLYLTSQPPSCHAVLSLLDEIQRNLAGGRDIPTGQVDAGHEIASGK